MQIKSDFKKNVLTLVTGTTVAQAIPILVSPILTRMYTPEEFGLFAMIIAIASIFGAIANGRYDLAIMVPKKEANAINIFAAGFISSIVFSMLLFFIIFIFNDYWNQFLDIENINFWLYFVPLLAFLIGVFNLLSYFNNREKNYKDIANANIVKSGVLVIIQLTLGSLKIGLAGLVNGQLFSQLIVNLQLLRKLIKNKILISKIKWIKIIALAKKYKKFPLYTSFATLLDIATLQMPFIFVIKIANETINGHFFLASRLISLPMSLIGSSIALVFTQKISEQKNKNQLCTPLLLKTIKKLFFVAFPFALVVFILSPVLFGVIFGEEWVDAGTIAQYLSVIFLIRFVVSPVSAILEIIGYVKRAAFWKYLYFSTSLTLYIVSIITNIDFFTFLLLLVVHEYILYGLYIYLIIISTQELDKNTQLKVRASVRD